MANLDTLAIITGQKSLSDMTDDELRDHIRQVRHARLVPTNKPTPGTEAQKQKKSANASSKRTTKSPMDALLRSLGPEELEEFIRMLEEKEDSE